VILSGRLDAGGGRRPSSRSRPAQAAPRLCRCGDLQRRHLAEQLAAEVRSLWKRWHGSHIDESDRFAPEAVEQLRAWRSRRGRDNRHRDPLRISVQRRHPHDAAARAPVRPLGQLIAREAAVDHHFALATMFEMLDVASRADLKSDLLKELEKHKQQFNSYRGNPSISEAALDDITAKIDTRSMASTRSRARPARR
jgi:hypothetical protein